MFCYTASRNANVWKMQLISYCHCHRIASKYRLLTCTQTNRCVYHSLIARRVFCLSAGQRFDTQSPPYWLVSRAGNIAVHITRSNSPDINAVDYSMWHHSLACLPVLYVQNVNELKQHLLDVWYDMEQSIIDSAMSLQDCLRLKKEISSKCCNINNWLN